MGIAKDPSRNILDALLSNQKNLQAQIDQLRAQLMSPTVPIYDHTNFPPNAIEGQIAYGDDGLAYKFQSGTWTPIGGATLAGGQQRLSFSWTWTGNPTRAGTITYVSATTGDLLCDLTATGVSASPPRIKPFNAGLYHMTFIWAYNNWTSVVDRSITLRCDGQPFGYIGARSSLHTMSNLFPEPSGSCGLTTSIQMSYDSYVQMTIEDGGSNSSPSSADGDLTVDVVRIR